MNETSGGDQPTSSVAIADFIVRVIAETAVENETSFGDLDAVVGDGDFGYSMARGFEVVLQQWDGLDRSTPGAFLKATATVIASRLGGTSGPIWGTAFLRAGMSAGDRTELSAPDVVAMLRSSIEGIQKRGNAELGDKTLLDALVPAVDCLASEIEKGSDAVTAVHEMASVAQRSAEATRQMVAKRGRASYSGERSIGAIDPGAVAIAQMLSNVASRWPKTTGDPAQEEQ